VKTTGSTILIAGGTSGIGLALAERFHALGNKVIVAGRRRERLDQIAAEHPGIDGEVFDITDRDSIADLYQTVTAKYPELDAIIAMSGIMVPERVLDPTTVEVAERTITTNLLGTIRLVHQFAPFLVQQPEAAIVTVTSGLAYVPLAITPTYGATKAAVHSYTEALREQLRDTSVQVIEIAPPYLRTTLMGEQQANDENAMPLDEFADETISLLQTQPGAAQILVERVKRQRFAEANGNYDEVFAMQSGRTA
jgi:uncharacterized oxidoreductase